MKMISSCLYRKISHVCCVCALSACFFHLKFMTCLCLRASSELHFTFLYIQIFTTPSRNSFAMGWVEKSTSHILTTIAQSIIAYFSISISAIAYPAFAEFIAYFDSDVSQETICPNTVCTRMIDYEEVRPATPHTSTYIHTYMHT